MPISEIEAPDVEQLFGSMPLNVSSLNDEENQLDLKTHTIAKDVFADIKTTSIHSSCLSEKITDPTETAKAVVEASANAGISSPNLEKEVETADVLATAASENEKAENIQMRFSRLIAKVLEILAEMSLDEKTKINLIKKEIKEFTDIQAKSIKSQGWVALGTAIGGAVCSGISAFLPTRPGFNLLKDLLPKIGEVGKDTAARFLNAHYDEQNVRAQSQKDVKLREMDTSNNDVEAKAGSRRDFTDLLKEILNTASAASRGQ